MVDRSSTVRSLIQDRRAALQKALGHQRRTDAGWPTRGDLLYDTFSTANFPQARRVGDLRTDLLAHLEALRRALVDGPLAYLIHALNETAAHDPEIAELRDRLTKEGCEPIRRILADAIREGRLARLDIDHSASLIEGPLFYRTLVRHEAVPRRMVVTLVDHFLASVER